MGSFRLIALRPLKGVADHILKNLEVDRYYFFDGSYEPQFSGDGVKKKTQPNGVPADDFFFSERQFNNGSSLKFVNFQAIVGKNGEGKSTLLDFVIRLLNNYHAKNLPERFNQLLFIEKVYGELYFEIDQAVYRMKYNQHLDKKASFSLEKSIQFEQENEAVYKEIGNSEVLFFTLGINYSLYSLGAKYSDHLNQNKSIIVVGTTAN